MKKLLLVLLVLIISGCASNFVGNIPSESVNGVRFITGNEVFSKNEYQTEAIVVVTRDEYFWDFFGLIKNRMIFLESYSPTI